MHTIKLDAEAKRVLQGIQAPGMTPDGVVAARRESRVSISRDELWERLRIERRHDEDVEIGAKVGPDIEATAERIRAGGEWEYMPPPPKPKRKKRRRKRLRTYK